MMNRYSLFNVIFMQEEFTMLQILIRLLKEVVLMHNFYPLQKQARIRLGFMGEKWYYTVLKRSN